MGAFDLVTTVVSSPTPEQKHLQTHDGDLPHFSPGNQDLPTPPHPAGSANLHLPADCSVERVPPLTESFLLGVATLQRSVSEPWTLWTPGARDAAPSTQSRRSEAQPARKKLSTAKDRSPHHTGGCLYGLDVGFCVFSWINKSQEISLVCVS